MTDTQDRKEAAELARKRSRIVDDAVAQAIIDSLAKDHIDAKLERHPLTGRPRYIHFSVWSRKNTWGDNGLQFARKALARWAMYTQVRGEYQRGRTVITSCAGTRGSYHWFVNVDGYEVGSASISLTENGTKARSTVGGLSSVHDTITQALACVLKPYSSSSAVA